MLKADTNNKAENNSVANTLTAQLPRFEAVAVLDGTVTKTHGALYKRLMHVFNFVTSKKNLLAAVGVALFCVTQPYLAAGLLALAMVLNTVEKCFNLNLKLAELKLSTANAANAEVQTLQAITAKLNK